MSILDWLSPSSALASFVSKVLVSPLLGSVVDGYKAKLAAGTSHDTLAADLAGRELAVQQLEIQAQAQMRVAEIGHWSEPDKIMGYTAAFLYGKIVVWDICLGWGSTDLHQGFVTITTGLIVSFYFGKRGIENVAKIWKK